MWHTTRGVLLFGLASSVAWAADIDLIVRTFKGDKEMLWGSATASYQVEGGWNEGGRQPTIWDDWFHSGAKWRRFHDQNDTGDVADDFYHQWPEDVERMHQLGFGGFRLSIAWSRVLPYNRPNSVGIQFYADLLGRLQERGIQPLVTLFHWDLPNDKDWESPEIVNQFLGYADLCFQKFGHLVKRWLTFNEPWVFCGDGYGSDGFPPAKNSTAARYRCGHHVLLAHAAVVRLYREKYQKQQGGQIGITLNYDWAEPYDTQNPEHVEAAQLHRDFNLGWFADPVYLTGDYPASMRKYLGELLPRFSAEESAALRGSFDFYGANHYTSSWVRPAPGRVPPVEQTTVRDDGTPIGPQGDSSWLYIVPWGIERVLRYIHAQYPAVKMILVTENGLDAKGESEKPFPQVLNDTDRVNYYAEYLTHVARARQDGVPVRGYVAWSFLDNLEWNDGLTKRFGINYVDFKSSPPKRYTKASARWFSDLFKKLKVASEAPALVV